MSLFKELTKKYLRGPVLAIRMAYGYFIHLLSKKNPPNAYQSMVALFCLTRGKSNDFAHRIAILGNKPYPISDASGVLGKLEPQKIKSIVSDIRTNGYYVFEQKLPDNVCQRMLEFSLEHPAKIRSCTTNLKKGVGASTAKYDRENPKGVRYDYAEDVSLECSEIQSLVADTSLISVAQAYLNCKPILDIVAFWWHTKYGDEPDDDAAQLYHFDMDRIKWLKFFFYITDVTTESGPHCFIAKSHRTGGIPSTLLRKGYQRLTDEEVAAHFPNKRDFIEFSAPRGTIIAEDTRGLHKGKQVENGDRLIFQMEFCDSLFGAKFEQGIIPANTVTELAIAREKFPRVYSKFQSA